MVNNIVILSKRVLVFGLLLGGSLLAFSILHNPLVHADVGLPSWWSGKLCDTNNYAGSYQLSSSSVYGGVIACGPGPNQGGTDHAVQFTGYTFTNYEWECVELSERYLDLVFGVAPYSAPGGKDIVNNYPGTALAKVTNNGSSLPTPGDVFSESGTQQNMFGHTGIVTAVSVTNGSGSVSIIEQNNTANGLNTISVSGNILQSNVTGWLHSGVTTSALRTIPTSDGHIQTFNISSGALSENWYSPSTEAVGTWTQPVAMPATPTGTPAVALRSGQNVIDVFVRGSNNNIYETWYNFQFGTWGGWINMGGSVTSDPQVLATADGHYQVFGTGNSLVQQNWFAPNGTFGGWAHSIGLGANAVGSPALVARPAGQNTIDEFVRGGNNQIYETWYNWGNGAWGGWIGMGGAVTSDPQAISTSDGHDQVFGTGSNLVRQNWFSPSNGSVGGWTTSAGLAANAIGSPAIAQRSGQNVIDEFVRGGDNLFYETWYSFQTGGWGGWINMGGYTTSDPQTQPTSDGNDQVFGTSNNQTQQDWFTPNTGSYGSWLSF